MVVSTNGEWCAIKKFSGNDDDEVRVNNTAKLNIPPALCTPLEAEAADNLHEQVITEDITNDSAIEIAEHFDDHTKRNTKWYSD